MALVVLIVIVLAWRRVPEEEKKRKEPLPAIADRQTVPRSELSAPPRSPKPIDDPNRIKETLQAGKTYEVVIKGGFDARVEDQNWGIKEVVSMAYYAEMAIDRNIESNDGRKVVELRHFVAARNTKLLCNVEDVTIELGAPGKLLLTAIGYVKPEAVAVMVMVKPIALAILRTGRQEAAQSELTKAFAYVDGLSGKKVRITYVDGLGVESIEPVGCTLSAQERDFIFTTAVLSDCYIWDLKKAPGERWKVDGAQLSGFIDPSLRGATEGEIGFIRDADGEENGRPYARLRIEHGTLSINTSDASMQRVGSFTPQGVLNYSLTDKIVETANLTGQLDIEEVSKNHILFVTRFRTHPTLKVQYSCKLR
jgi:hypothetical protein